MMRSCLEKSNIGVAVAMSHHSAIRIHSIKQPHKQTRPCKTQRQQLEIIVEVQPGVLAHFVCHRTPFSSMYKKPLAKSLMRNYYCDEMLSSSIYFFAMRERPRQSGPSHSHDSRKMSLKLLKKDRQEKGGNAWPAFSLQDQLLKKREV